MALDYPFLVLALFVVNLMLTAPKLDSLHPEVKWAQRVDKVFITVQLPDAKDAKVNLEPEGVFNFTANAGTGNSAYELKLELFDKVNVEVC